jgi:ABC-type antimicrobial peptide transport system permease subunit
MQLLYSLLMGQSGLKHVGVGVLCVFVCVCVCLLVFIIITVAICQLSHYRVLYYINILPHFIRCIQKVTVHLQKHVPQLEEP